MYQPPDQPFYRAPQPPQRQPGRFMSWYRRQARAAQIIIGIAVVAIALFFCSAAASGIAQGIAGSAVTPTKAATIAPTPTTRPTAAPTTPPAPTAIPTPTTAANLCPAAVNNNPWCLDFNSSGGQLVYTPPDGFCSYFACIATFYASDDPGDGYIVQCQDGMYSQSGGESGSCSHHGGDARPLYSH